MNKNDFFESEKALENFLKNAKELGFDYKYNSNNELIITITKDSNIDKASDFFRKFVERDFHKAEEKIGSIFPNFFEMELHWLSSGEQENLALFSSIDEQISLNPDIKSYILLFDEIERSMHPELCRNLVQDLIKLLEQYKDKKFQIIIASHSPFIVSDLLKDNIVCIERNNNDSIIIENLEQTFAQNIYTMLKSQFFLDSFMGQYSTECIHLLLDCLKLDGIEEVKCKINEFLNFTDCETDKNNSLSKMMTNDDVIPFIKYLVNSIGEPMIRNELTERLLKKAWCSIDDQIKYYEDIVANLKNKRGKHND